MEMKFKIGDWVAHEATVVRKPEGDRDERLARPPRIDTRSTEKATYIGRVKKIVMDETNITYFVVFGPDDQWKPMLGGELEEVAIIHNPAKMAPRRPPSGHPGDDDYNPIPKTER